MVNRKPNKRSRFESFRQTGDKLRLFRALDHTLNAKLSALTTGRINSARAKRVASEIRRSQFETPGLLVGWVD